MPRTNKPYVTSRSGPLAELRVKAGLTGKAAAEVLYLSPARLGNIEHGLRATDELLQKISAAYGISYLTVRRAYLAGRRDFIAREKP